MTTSYLEFSNEITALRVIDPWSSIWWVALTVDEQRAVSASGDGTIKVWDLGSRREVGTLISHRRGVTAVAVTRTGSARCLLLLTGS